MTGHFTTEAVVLNSIDYGESDRIITCYTLNFGKIKGIAKGAKRSKRRFVNKLDPFSYIKLLFFQKQGRELAILEEAETIRRFDNLMLDIERLTVGSYCLELLNEMTPEGQKNQKVFELLLKSLIMLSEKLEIRTIVMCFEMHLLSILGYYPHLEKCVICKNISTNDNKVFFSSEKSGILCVNCSKQEKGLIPVSPGAVKFLMLAAKTDIDKIHRIILSDWAVEEGRGIMDNFIRYQLGKELKSKRFMEKIQFK